MDLKVNYIENEGHKIFYRVCGRENRDTMVYIHGLAGDSRFFHNQMRYFSSKFKVLALDLPGHGRSSGFGEQSVEYYDWSINRIIEKENIDQYIRIGHSMGGCISLEHYKKNKDKIKAIILVSTAAKLPIDETIMSHLCFNFDNFINKMLSNIFNKKAGIFILAAQKQMTEEQKNVIIEDLKICSSFDYLDLLDSIDIPVLIIANRFDKMIPVNLTEEMHRRVRGSELVVFDEKGHVPFFENSETFNCTVKNFIDSIPKH